MSGPQVLVADPLAPAGIDLLRSKLDVVEAGDGEALLATLPTSDALIVRSRTRVTSDLLDRAGRLRLVARAGIGVDNIDVEAASRRGVLVINAPQGNVRSTAEHTVGLIFALARLVVAADAAVRNGRWKSGYEGTQIAGKRLGIVGMGKVGRQVASMARGLDMEVVAFDPYLSAEDWRDLFVQQLDLETLLVTSDFVTVHVPMMEGTRGLIGSRELAGMKQGSYLINCARGGIVDEAPLIDVLSGGHLAGAALDVFLDEPVPAGSPLLTAPNLILTPHVAASTREAQVQVSTEVAAQVLDFFDGRPVAYPVNNPQARRP